jgi:methyl-accepting chemotaxis protein
MDEMTQQNAALVEESSAASRAMSEEARNMNNMIGFFNMGHGGGAPSYASNPEPVIKYQTAAAPAPSSIKNKGSDSAASFSNNDEWEDF